MSANNEIKSGVKDRVLVLGIGNIFYGDDGIGSILARNLTSSFNAQNVDVIDGGTTGLGLLYLLDDYSDLIVIDSVDIGREPGEVFLFEWEDLAALARQDTVSTHQPGVIELLRLGRMTGKVPQKIIILAVQIKRLVSEYGLSTELETAYPLIEQKIKEKIISFLTENA